MVEFLERGDWFIGIFNGRDTYSTVSLAAEPYAMEAGCYDDCNGNGECRDGECHCFPGYTSYDCSQPVCPLLCSGNGVYLRGQCQCNHGYKGIECNIKKDECAVPSCNKKGECVNGRCVCYQGYRGPHCGIAAVKCRVATCWEWWLTGRAVGYQVSKRFESQTGSRQFVIALLCLPSTKWVARSLKTRRK
ncbi:teneurin-2 [Plakobranchus ocellatus]|uniref:Teneurin-2 n=1 Tax=Plakobranchus ocellatus TaxID=259542 RepID=A0AAV4B4T2_9GAST|nr:teneurin-2 [Plakobranchus ocellatus]